MATVTLQDVRKVYPNGFEAVKPTSFTIADGEFLVLVGPSGCGKSTLLRMIAGLEDITGGTLHIGERMVNDTDPADRDIANRGRRPQGADPQAGSDRCGG